MRLSHYLLINLSMVLTTIIIEKKLFLPLNCVREVPLLKHVSYNRSKRVIDYPMLRKLNEASMFETTAVICEDKEK